MMFPFILGLVGFTLDGEPLLQAVYAGLCLYGMGQKELPPNVLVEIARWLAPLVSASAVVAAAKSIRRYLHDASARLSAESVGIHGPKAEKEAMLKALGHRGIDMEDKPVKADKYLLLGDEMDSLEYFHTYLEDTDRDVFLQSKSLSSRSVAKPNLYLFCPEETAARLFWEQYPLYPISRENNHHIRVAMIGFGSLGRELLLYGLQNHIFAPNQRISYDIWGEENGFTNIYYQLPRISDPVVFHTEPWHTSLETLDEAHMIIVAEQQDQLALLRDLTLALWNKPLHVMSVQPEGMELLSNLLISFNWKTMAMKPEHIFNEERLNYAKRVNMLYYDRYSLPNETNAHADQLWTRTNSFSRDALLNTTEYHRIQRQLLKDNILTEDTIELLAELDHTNWCRRHYLNNWEWGVPQNGRSKDMEKRIHLALLPYKDLDDRSRMECQYNVRQLFRLDEDNRWCR